MILNLFEEYSDASSKTRLLCFLREILNSEGSAGNCMMKTLRKMFMVMLLFFCEYPLDCIRLFFVWFTSYKKES